MRRADIDTPYPRQYVAPGSQGNLTFFEASHLRERRPRRMRPQMSGHESDEERRSREDLELRARLDRLSGALKEQSRDARERRAEANADFQGAETGRALSLGFRVLSEFVAAVVVGFLIGWQLDVWLSTTPLFLILFLGLGTAAGFYNVYRIAARPTGPAKPKDKA